MLSGPLKLRHYFSKKNVFKKIAYGSLATEQPSPFIVGSIYVCVQCTTL
jgi:hypothetical protein